MPYLYLSLGGALGTLSRYFLGGWVQSRLGLGFPYGTFFVNFTGCFLIGLSATLAGERLHTSLALRNFFFVGFLGAYTTFSTYMFENFLFLEQGKILLALVNMIGSVMVGILALSAGVYLGRL